MAWEVELTGEMRVWLSSLSPADVEDVTAHVKLLREYGPTLGWPKSSAIRTSRHGHMRELRVQHAGRAYRVLYAFDPRRVAILLVGGDKTGDKRWYDVFVPRADRLYDEHLEALRRKGLN